MVAGRDSHRRGNVPRVRASPVAGQPNQVLRTEKGLIDYEVWNVYRDNPVITLDQDRSTHPPAWTAYTGPLATRANSGPDPSSSAGHTTMNVRADGATGAGLLLRSSAGWHLIRGPSDRCAASSRCRRRSPVSS